jgi:hypothetical protein
MADGSSARGNCSLLLPSKVTSRSCTSPPAACRRPQRWRAPRQRGHGQPAPVGLCMHDGSTCEALARWMVNPPQHDGPPGAFRFSHSLRARFRGRGRHGIIPLGTGEALVISHQESGVSSHQESSGAIRSHQESSGVISSHQQSPGVIRYAIPPLPLRILCYHLHPHPIPSQF